MSSVGPVLTCLQVREGLPAGPPQDRLASSDFCKGGAHKGDRHVNGGNRGERRGPRQSGPRVLPERGGRPPRGMAVALWERGPSGLCASHVPKEAAHLAFEKCEVCPCLNVGLIILKHCAGQTKRASWLRRAGGATGLPAPVAGRDKERGVGADFSLSPERPSSSMVSFYRWGNRGPTPSDLVDRSPPTASLLRDARLKHVTL